MPAWKSHIYQSIIILMFSSFRNFLTWEYSKNIFCKIFHMSHVIDSHSTRKANMNIITSASWFVSIYDLFWDCKFNFDVRMNQSLHSNKNCWRNRWLKPSISFLRVVYFRCFDNLISMHVHIDKDKEERNKDIRIIGFLVYRKICDLNTEYTPQPNKPDKF